MNVLIVTPCLLPVPAFKGGAVETLVSALLQENEKNCRLKISLVTLECEESRNVAGKYRQTIFHFFKKNLTQTILDRIVFSFLKQNRMIFAKLFLIRYVRKILKKNQFDAVVLQNNGFLLEIFKNQQLLNKYRDKIFFHLHNDFPKSANKKIATQVKYILISHFLEKGVESALGYDKNRICRIVKNGIDTAKFSQTLSKSGKENLRKILNIEPSCRVIVFVGRLTPEKGIIPLLSAIEKLPNVVLVVVGATYFGSGELSDFERDLKKKAEKISEKIRFTGFVHNSEVWKYYALADYAVLPSIWEEPAGLTMLEAAASGTPLITTNKGGIPEYINPEYATLLTVDENLDSRIVESINQKNDVEKTYNLKRYVCENFDYKNFYNDFCDSIS